MAQTERHDLYLRPPILAPDYAGDGEEQTAKRPRLTLRYLHELIEDIHTENDRLADQIDTLTRQLDELSRKLDDLDALRDEQAAGLATAEPSARAEMAAASEAASDRAQETTAKEASVMLKGMGNDQALLDEPGDRQPGGAQFSGAAREPAGVAVPLPAVVEAADASEAFAKEWAQISLADAMPSSSAGGYGEQELPASLQERMIENVKEAARIAEEIAAQAAAHTAAGTVPAGSAGGAPEARATARGTDRRDTGEPPTGGLPLPEVQGAQPDADGPTAVMPAQPCPMPSGDGEMLPVPHGAARSAEPAASPALPRSADRAQPNARRDRLPSTDASAPYPYIPPRSERHAGSKKRSFWSRLFRRASI